MFNGKPKSKYGNTRTEGYASKAEARRAAELRLLQSAGRISGLEEQVRFEIIPKQDGERKAEYWADFTYWENGVYVVEDCKGVRTPVYNLKKKLMLLVHGIRIKEVA